MAAKYPELEPQGSASRITLPSKTTRYGAGLVKVGEALFETSTGALLLGKDTDTYAEMVQSLAEGSGISITGSNGILTLALDSADVVLTTTDQSIAGVK